MSHSVTLINMVDGSVAGHKAGCRDIKRNRRQHADGEPWTLEVDFKFEAFEAYNSDFIDEAQAEGAEDIYYNTYPIEWLPCADHVPSSAAPEETPADEVTMKVTGKWVRFYNTEGYEVGRIRATELGQVAALIS